MSKFYGWKNDFNLKKYMLLFNNVNILLCFKMINKKIQLNICRDVI